MPSPECRFRLLYDTYEGTNQGTDQSSHQGTSDLVGLLHAGSGCCKKKKKMVQEVVIVAALRTPIGSFNGALAPLHAHEVLKTLQLFDLICNKTLVFTDTTSQGILTVLSLN